MDVQTIETPGPTEEPPLFGGFTLTGEATEAEPLSVPGDREISVTTDAPRRSGVAVILLLLILAFASSLAAGLLLLDRMRSDVGQEVEPTPQTGPGIFGRADLDAYPEADSLRIEIPLSPSEPAGGDLVADASTSVTPVDPSLQPLQLVIVDGALVLRGTAASQEQADEMMAKARPVFGSTEIVEEYDVDPAAPAPNSGVVVQKPVVFETGSAEIREEFKPILDACADVLRFNPSLIMNVSGHTDDVGDASFNVALAEARAQAIIDYYESQGISTEKFDLHAAGESQPIESNETEGGRESNRRADLEIVGVFDEVLEESGRGSD